MTADLWCDITEEDRNVLAAWDLGRIVSGTLPATGTINRTLLVKSERGAFVLRVSSRERQRVEWEQECIALAAEAGLPVCRPIPTPQGTIIERGGKFYALFPFAAGHQLTRTELTAEHAQAAGECLGRIHKAFQTLPAGRAKIKNLTGDKAGALTSIPSIEAAIQALPVKTETEQAALEQLWGRHACLAQTSSADADIPERLAALPQRVLHGDYQETNLFFQGTRVSAIIDWDQSGHAARGWEIVRAMHLMFQLEPALCRAFLDGYESISALERGELAESAACYGALVRQQLVGLLGSVFGRQHAGKAVYHGGTIRAVRKAMDGIGIRQAIKKAGS